MAEVFTAYLDAGKPERFILRIAAYWKDSPVQGITPEAIRRSARLIYPNAKPATWNRQVIAPMVAALNYAAQLGWCQSFHVKRFPVNAQEKVPASPSWVQTFAAQAEEDGLPHLAALALFMFGTGARVGEATALTWADVDLSNETATIHQTKTKHVRTAHLQPPVVAAIANIPSNRNPADKVFRLAGTGSVTKVWNNIVERAKIETLTPHCCRHGFATTMLQKGFDVATVAKLGGWKDATTVLRTYAHALDDKTVSNVIFDTKPTQVMPKGMLSSGNKKGIGA